jgi:transposase
VSDQASATTAMLGLSGFVLLSVSQLGGELVQTIETTESGVGCTGCGTPARLHDRRAIRVRDLPSAGRPVVLVWRKRVWRCVEPACATSTWTEQSGHIRPRAVLTERARQHACRRVGQCGHSVAAVAAELGVGWSTVMAAVTEYGSPLVDDPRRLEPVGCIGVDETAFQAASARRSTTFATGIVDLTGGRARLLDVVEGRSAQALSGWIDAREPGWRQQIRVAVLDPYRGNARALSTGLPGAVRVLDAFHVIRLAFTAVDDVRTRVQQETMSHRGRRGEPLYRIRRLLRRGAERLSPAA